MPRSTTLNGRVVLAFLLLPLAVTGCHRPSATDSGKEITAAKKAPAAPPPPKPEPIEARALYVTGWTAGGTKAMGRIMNLIGKTPLNAVVIDVKDSDGAVTYPTQVPLAKQIMAKVGSVPQIREHEYGKRAMKIGALLAELKKRNIYPIARIAVFSDDILPRVRPDLSVKRPDGSLWFNRKHETWCNPYKKEVWEYVVSLGEEAIRKGFKEVQWDYVRFPTDGKLSEIRFPGKTALPPSQQIDAFLKFASHRIHAAGGVMSADIFGLTVLSKGDMGIGQTIRAIAENCDFICPMVYPSHYHLGEYGIPNPDKEPYKIVFVSLRDGLKRIAGTHCQIRPWLQNFNLQSKYHAPEIWAQIKAAHDNGINQYLLWDPNNRFTNTGEAFQLMAASEAKEKNQVAKKPAGVTTPSGGTPAPAPIDKTKSASGASPAPPTSPANAGSSPASPGGTAALPEKPHTTRKS